MPEPLLQVAEAIALAANSTEPPLAWSAEWPNPELHFTPTSTSWLNLLKRFLGETTRMRIWRSEHQ